MQPLEVQEKIHKIFYMKQNFYKFYTNSWESLETTLGEAALLNTLVGNGEEKNENLWRSLEVLNSFVSEEMKNQDDSFLAQKAVIQLLDISSLHQLSSQVTALQQQFSLLRGSKVGAVSSGDLTKSLASLFVNEEVLKDWDSSFSVLSSDQQKDVLRAVQGIVSLYPILLDQVKSILAVVGPVEVLVPYSLDDIKNFFASHGAEFDWYRMMYSIGELSSWDAESYDVFRLIFVYLQNQLVQNSNFDFEWRESFEFSLFLALAYKRFSNKSLTVGSEYVFLLEHYLYKAEVIGISVKGLLTQKLLECDWIVKYLDTNAQFVLCFEKNEEVIPLTGETKGISGKLSNVFEKYVSSGNIAVLQDEKKISEFLTTFYPKDGSVFKNYLQEIISIYILLKQGKLVDWVNNGYIAPDEIQNVDLSRLFVYFAYDKSLPKIVEYYRNTSPALSLTNFLKALSLNVDLSDQKMVDRCVNLSSVLLENNLLQQGKDFITYDESDNQFHWNEEVFIN